jgi:hypothetical protein
VRFKLHAASVFLALSVALTSCSSGNEGPRVVPAGGTPLENISAGPSCPTRYIECIALSYRHPFAQEWCVVSNGHGDAYAFNASQCGNPVQGYCFWVAHTYTVSSFEPFHRLKASLSSSQGPCNTELTIAEKRRVKPSRGQIKYEARIEVCVDFSGGCFSLGNVFIGIATK